MPDPTEQHFRGTLTERDVKRNLRHAVNAAAAATRIRVQLGFEPAMAGGHRNMICITVFDPAGFRGAGHRHGNRHVVEIAHDAATPGFLPGPLPAGRWVIQLDTHLVMPGAPCRYELAVAFDHGDAPPGGQELTTFWGHALCLGGHRWHDWRVTQTGPEMAVLAERMLAAGELFVIAHPRTEGDPHCTGCRWLYPGPDPLPVLEHERSIQAPQGTFSSSHRPRTVDARDHQRPHQRRAGGIRRRGGSVPKKEARRALATGLLLRNEDPGFC